MANPLPYLNTSDPLQQSLNNLAAGRIHNVEPTQPSGSLEELQQYARDNGYVADSVIVDGSPSNIAANEAIANGEWPGYEEEQVSAAAYNPMAVTYAPGYSSKDDSADSAGGSPSNFQTINGPIDKYKLSELDQKLGKELEHPIEQLMPSFEKEMNKKSREFMATYLPQQMEKELDDKVEREKEAKRNELQTRINAGELLTDNDIEREVKEYGDQVRSELSDPGSLRNQADRRFLNADGSYNFSMGGPNLFGFTAQRESGGAVRDLQDYYYRQKDLSGSQRTPQEVKDTSTSYIDENGDRIYVEKDGRELSEIEHWLEQSANKNNLVDDGINPAARESLWISGEEYINQRLAGLPGRPIAEISADEVYNKQEEQDNYGYVPYLTSWEAVDKFHDDAGPQKISSLFNDLGNLRRDQDFDVYVDGEQVSGKDLMRRSNSYFDTYSKQMNEAQRGENNRVVTDESETNEWSVPQKLVLKTADGDIEATSKLVSARQGVMTEDYGQLIGKTNDEGKPLDEYYSNIESAINQGGIIQTYKNDEGGYDVWLMNDKTSAKAVAKNIVYTFEDGSYWLFEDEEDLANNPIEAMEQDKADAATSQWLNIDPLELADGTKIRSDKARDLLFDKDSDNYWETHADFSPDSLFGIKALEPLADAIAPNWKKPDLGDPRESDDIRDWLPWITDVALQSAPLFNPVTAGAQASSNALSNLQGMHAGELNPYQGSFAPLSENAINRDIAHAAVGSALMPLSERILGNIGNGLIRIPSNFMKNSGTSGAVARYALGTGGEAVEEVFGDLFEEFQRSGLRDFYADDLLNEDGSVQRDEYGNPKKDPNTTDEKRFQNYLEGVGLSAIGGGMLGGIMGGVHLPSDIKASNMKREAALKRAADDAKLGASNLVRRYDADPNASRMSEEDRKRFNEMFGVNNG